MDKIKRLCCMWKAIVFFFKSLENGILSHAFLTVELQYFYPLFIYVLSQVIPARHDSLRPNRPQTLTVLSTHMRRNRCISKPLCCDHCGIWSSMYPLDRLAKAFRESWRLKLAASSSFIENLVTVNCLEYKFAFNLFKLGYSWSTVFFSKNNIL
jgi:hypothetical protein